jgi:hypothetical protein
MDFMCTFTLILLQFLLHLFTHIKQTRLEIFITLTLVRVTCVVTEIVFITTLGHQRNRGSVNLNRDLVNISTWR